MRFLFQLLPTALVLGVVVPCGLVTAMTNENSHPNYASASSMSLLEQASFREVAQECRDDVQNLCIPSDATSRMSSMQRSLGMPPFLHAPPPHPLEDLDAFLNHFLQPNLIVHRPMLPERLVLVMQGSSSDDDGGAETTMAMERSVMGTVNTPKPPCPRVHAMLSQIVSTTDSSHFDAIAEKMNAKGREVIQSAYSASETAPDEEIFVTARRLQEITPTDLHAFLPFVESDCLERHYRMGHVSHPCGAALSKLFQIRTQGEQTTKAELDYIAELTTFYWILFMLLVAIVIKRRGSVRNRIQLRNAVIRTVYSNPSIKAAVQKAVGGRRLGFVPPLVPRRMSKPARAVMKVMLFVLLLTWLISPSSVLCVASFLASVAFWAILCANKTKAEICTCCCCGMSSDDFANGLAMDSCCACCQGTGVCSVQCATCCGDNGCNCGCGAGCCCSCCGSGCCSKGDGCCAKEGSCCCGCSSKGGGCCCGCGMKGDGSSCYSKECCETPPKQDVTAKKRTVLTTKSDSNKNHDAVYEGIPLIQIV